MDRQNTVSHAPEPTNSSLSTRQPFPGSEQKATTSDIATMDSSTAANCHYQLRGDNATENRFFEDLMPPSDREAFERELAIFQEQTPKDSEAVWIWLTSQMDLKTSIQLSSSTTPSFSVLANYSPANSGKNSDSYTWATTSESESSWSPDSLLSHFPTTNGSVTSYSRYSDSMLTSTSPVVFAPPSDYASDSMTFSSSNEYDPRTPGSRALSEYSNTPSDEVAEEALNIAMGIMEAGWRLEAERTESGEVRYAMRHSREEDSDSDS
ncbi:hypothetical protein BDN70DRAFT_928899 [Pholiota conissans]|uniref:Uncharacterized protein n=1 Tax=Pholiota conissans TaxID=109636 RepID=A0A9P5ZC09_9AGAR|nr:hypothetical protein BDN70DRAFT_928899 [Pholiota conissans]